jgi:hypothetical protein
MWTCILHRSHEWECLDLSTNYTLDHLLVVAISRKQVVCLTCRVVHVFDCCMLGVSLSISTYAGVCNPAPTPSPRPTTPHHTSPYTTHFVINLNMFNTCLLARYQCYAHLFTCPSWPLCFHVLVFRALDPGKRGRPTLPGPLSPPHVAC